MRKFKLHESLDAHIPRRVVADLGVISLADEKSVTPSKWVNITRVGQFYDRRYGVFQITLATLQSMVKNFDARTFGQDVFLDVEHCPQNGAAAKFTALKIEGDRLMGLAEFTPYGVESIKEKLFQYLSAEFTENFIDNETGSEHGPVLLGAGLTTRPVIKGLYPVQLSDPGNAPVFFHADVTAYLLNEARNMKEKLLKRLKAMLAAKALSSDAQAKLLSTSDSLLDFVTTEEAGEKFLSEMSSMVEALEKTPGQPLHVQLSATGVTADDVVRILSEERTRLETEARALSDRRAANIKLLSDTIGGTEGLADDLKKELSDSVQDLVTAQMTEDQVKALANNQITLGKRLSASSSLASMGFVAGTPHIVVPLEGAKKLSGIYHDNLKRTDSFMKGQIKLPEKVSGFVELVLSEYDRLNARQIEAEAKFLSAGTTGMGDVSLPVGVQREVIREALSDLNVLQLVQQLTDFAATTTTQIPYELRDTSGVGNDGVTYESQGIQRASISQQMDTAFITPTKLAFLISNEVIHFSRTSQINWDALGRNIESNARIVRELIHRRIVNELQRSSDAYMAVAITAESFSSQLTGAVSQIKTTAFPIVRPFQARDMKGVAQGSAENPITVTLNSAVINAYDGTGTQSVGTYYRVLSYNLGYIQFVNQSGAPVTPSNTGTNTISYSKASNVIKVDLDVPAGSTIEKQMNKVLQAIGSRKAVLSGQRYVTPDYLLMSPVMNDQCTNAESFVASMKRNGSDTSADGDLERIKGLPTWGTNAPGLDMGDERILIGQRGALGYSISKPFITGEPFEVVNSNGLATGQKQAYGEEYSAIKMPTPIRNRMTSVLAYSFTGR